MKRVILTIAAHAIFLVPPPVARAQEYRAEAFAAPPPEELAGAVRGLLGERGIRVLGPSGTLVEIWFRKAVPAGAGGAGLGIAYPGFVEGALVGVARIPSPVRDYRNRQVKPGVYTLRYARHPVNGDHMGVAPYRDFLLLGPAAEDATADPKGFEDLVALSKKASGSTHPAVWSLPAPEDQPASTPTLVRHEEESLWLLYTTVTVESDAGETAEIPLALVVVGHAPEA